MPSVFRSCLSVWPISVPHPIAAPMMCSLLLPNTSGVLLYFAMEALMMDSRTRESRLAISWPTHSAVKSSLPLDFCRSAIARIAGITMGGICGTGSISRPFHNSALANAATAALYFPPTPSTVDSGTPPISLACMIPIFPLSEAMPPRALPSPSNRMRLLS